MSRSVHVVDPSQGRRMRRPCRLAQASMCRRLRTGDVGILVGEHPGGIVPPGPDVQLVEGRQAVAVGAGDVVKELPLAFTTAAWAAKDLGCTLESPTASTGTTAPTSQRSRRQLYCRHDPWLLVKPDLRM